MKPPSKPFLIDKRQVYEPIWRCSPRKAQAASMA